MRYRISAILLTLMALVGLSAPAAFAAPQAQLPANCSQGQTYPASGSFHIIANANTSVGITYHGPGNLITVNDPPGDSIFICVNPPNTYVIHNAAGNCFRMRDASNDYTVIEETGCLDDNTNYRFQAFNIGSGHYQFENVHFGRWLGTTDCPPVNGSTVLGVPNAGGNCLTWLLQ
jgi:hypothetical protein